MKNSIIIILLCFIWQTSNAQENALGSTTYYTPTLFKKRTKAEKEFEQIVKPEELALVLKMILSKEIPVDKIIVPTSGLEIRQILKTGFEGNTLQISPIRPSFIMDDSEIIMVLFAVIEQKKSGKTKLKKMCFVEYTEGIFLETHSKGEDKKLPQKAIDFLLSQTIRRQ